MYSLFIRMRLIKKSYNQATMLADASAHNRGRGSGGGPKCALSLKVSQDWGIRGLIEIISAVSNIFKQQKGQKADAGMGVRSLRIQRGRR